MQRAREKGLLPPKLSIRSRSRSKSPRSRPRRPCTSSSTQFVRLESADGTAPIFKVPEDTKISTVELRRIKVDIHRNIPGRSTDSDLQRDIINPEDVVVNRRAEEGSKPIFEREEIKGIITKTEEVEEHRIIVTVNNDTLEGKSKTFKRRSASLSPIGNRRRSRERYRSRNRSKEYEDSSKEKERRRTDNELHIVEEERNRRSRDHSRSREREERKRDRDTHHRERSRNSRGEDRCGLQRVPSPQYMGPVPIYYKHLPPRPMMTPLMPMRGQGLLRNGHPSMMGPPSLRPSTPVKYSSDLINETDS